MAVDLSYAIGSVHEAARELGIDSIAPANRSHYQMAADLHRSPAQPTTVTSGLSQEQQLIRRLQKELKDAEIERDILKTGAPVRGRSASSLGKTAPADRGNLPIYSGSRPPIPC